ncbi:MAG: hypothetical protein B6I20_10650 [Bacteroidetes bacterium 4572_117]|nr:MAG: hypothetical protein B6I20_10650 [Bacteroidetes bacterium 4572_117]
MHYKRDINILDFYGSLDENTLLSYKGPIDTRILQVIGSYLEGLLKESPKAGRKVFKIFIELAQNISYYSAEKSIIRNNEEIGTGMVLISDSINHYIFVTGNLVKNDDIVTIIEKSEIINSLNREELREYKREQRKLPVGQKGGAHIGLIQVALTSAHPLDIEVNPIDDDYSFFSIAVKIDK